MRKSKLILKDGETVSPEGLINWSKDQMAAYKYPRLIEILESLPMTATGKILKKELSPELGINK